MRMCVCVCLCIQLTIRAGCISQAAMKIAMQRAVIVVSEYTRMMRDARQARAAGAPLTPAGGKARRPSSVLMAAVKEKIIQGAGGSSSDAMQGAEVLQMLTGKPLRDEDGNEIDSRSPVSGGSPAGSFRRQAPAADGGGQAAILAPVVRMLEAGARERAALGQSVKQLQQQLEELKSMVAI